MLHHLDRIEAELRGNHSEPAYDTNTGHLRAPSSVEHRGQSPVAQGLTGLDSVIETEEDGPLLLWLSSHRHGLSDALPRTSRCSVNARLCDCHITDIFPLHQAVTYRYSPGMTTYGYIRTSRQRIQGTSGSDPASQAHQLHQDGVPEANIHRDVGISGGTGPTAEPAGGRSIHAWPPETPWW